MALAAPVGPRRKWNIPFPPRSTVAISGLSQQGLRRILGVPLTIVIFCWGRTGIRHLPDSFQDGECSQDAGFS